MSLPRLQLLTYLMTDTGPESRYERSWNGPMYFFFFFTFVLHGLLNQLLTFSKSLVYGAYLFCHKCKPIFL